MVVGWRFLSHYLDQTLFKYLFGKKNASLNMTNDCIENVCHTIEFDFKMMRVRVRVHICGGVSRRMYMCLYVYIEFIFVTWLLAI